MEYTIEQLKSMAYDRIVVIQNAQLELEQINKAIKDFDLAKEAKLVEENIIEEPKEEVKEDK